MVENISYSAGAIVYKQGTHAEISIRLKSGTTTTSLTGYAASLEIQKDYATKVNAAVISGTIASNTSGDYFVFTFTPTSLSGVRMVTDEVDYVYQIKVIDAAAKVSIPLQGTITIIKDLAL